MAFLMCLIVLITAPPDDSPFRCIGMIDHGAELGTTIGALDFGRKDMGVAVPAGHPIPAQDLCLNQVKNLRFNDRFVAFRHIILRNFSVIDEHLFGKVIRNVFLLQEGIALILFICQNVADSRANPLLVAVWRFDTHLRQFCGDTMQNQRKPL